MLYTIYQKTTGQFVRSGACPEKLLSKQVRAGEAILAGQALCDVQFFVQMGENGLPVRDQAGQLVVSSYPIEELAERAPYGWRPTATAADASDLVEAGINPELARRFAQLRMDQAWGALRAAQEAPLT